ncbi:MAG: hypothetical protein MJ235_07765 [archaeon]|nr:hypothetical protein [archaeon]
MEKSLATLQYEKKNNWDLNKKDTKDTKDPMEDIVNRLKLEKSFATLSNEKKNNWNIDEEEKKKKG